MYLIWCESPVGDDFVKRIIGVTDEARKQEIVDNLNLVETQKPIYQRSRYWVEYAQFVTNAATVRE